MEQAPAPSVRSKTTPRDFFYWLGAIIALYGSVIAFISLKFAYINHFFPDILTPYMDPYGGPFRASMAALIVFVPTMIVLFWLIRRTILEEGGKADIWVRRWALVFTMFLAIVTILIDLVTLINTYLGGEITTRFALKVVVVLVVALIAFFYFLADIKGYWIGHAGRARLVAIVTAAVALLTVVAGFFIIGSPSHIRDLRLDAERVNALQSIQAQVAYYYQTKRSLPESLESLNDPLTGFVVPTDPETGATYAYRTTGPLSFALCAAFNTEFADRRDSKGMRVTAIESVGAAENWAHGAGETCFDRTIDPDRYPPLKPVPVPAL